MIQMQREDVLATLRGPIDDAVRRLVRGGASDLVQFGTQIAALSADAAIAGNQEVLDRIPSQLRALGEANRVDVAEEGMRVLENTVQTGVGVLVGMASRGLVRLEAQS